MKIMQSDFHFPSAPTATAKMTQIQNQKGHNPASPTLRTLQAHPSIGKDFRRAASAKHARRVLDSLVIAYCGCACHSERSEEPPHLPLPLPCSCLCVLALAFAPRTATKFVFLSAAKNPRIGFCRCRCRCRCRRVPHSSNARVAPFIAALSRWVGSKPPARQALALASEIDPSFSLGTSAAFRTGGLTPGTRPLSPHHEIPVNPPRSHPRILSPILKTTYAPKIPENSWHGSYAQSATLKL